MSSNPPTPSAPGSVPPRSNPFAPPPSGTSPSGGLSRPPSPPSFFSRLGARASFDYMPMHDALVMFDLRSAAVTLAEEFAFPLEVKDPNALEMIDAKTIIAAMENNKPQLEALKKRLNDYWASFKLVGAVHVYDWREEVKQAATNRLNAIKQPPHFIRATDPYFVLNVLGRARSYLLIHGAALALDRPFLERVIMSDDPRLIHAAKETRYSEDSLVPPPPPDDIFEDDDDEDDK